jgi:hypothetical protein
MAYEQLVKDIKRFDGKIFSEATLRLGDLLTSAYDLMKDYQLDDDASKELMQDIRDIFGHDDPTSLNDYYHNLRDIDSDEDLRYQASELWERVSDHFEALSPEGFYFGTSEGDGACFGWFMYPYGEEF